MIIINQSYFYLWKIEIPRHLFLIFLKNIITNYVIRYYKQK
jgi:hypothetical protein